jgi:hypothetical protein|tara:strand:+ start:1152 stop:1313 length:162 start_codon:yes stop_codon:yes gene_type:complete
MKKSKQFEHYKEYEMKDSVYFEGVVVICRFLAKDDEDAELYKNKVRSGSAKNN